jgi:hypothetical protein
MQRRRANCKNNVILNNNNNYDKVTNQPTPFKWVLEKPSYVGKWMRPVKTKSWIFKDINNTVDNSTL